MGGRAVSRSRNAMPGAVVEATPKFPRVRFTELEFHRIIGTGQFGLVRVVRNIRTNEVYALKVMHKAPIVESKQIEHVINERKILEEACVHPFCVRLCGAYQDKASLFLLQEWVPGGELFHHLDVEGAFDEPTAMFYAANVLLALEFLHTKGIVYRDLKPENLLMDTQVNPDKRLGSDKRLGADEIKRHRWFSRIDWKALEARKLPSPFRPRVRNPLDTSNFDNFDNVDLDPPPVPADRQEKHNSQWELWDWIDGEHR
ncbi:cAMP-dependent protein kinase catalytic subunit beta [Tetrabaena socialis]|uniref:cAMP-dependent protein kinase catalytic subunit beta n=1 Tax=Tetrabaena socialis TaxID=47790 RepID=A0A2J7ZLD9_9CHLO|nr:cAMP-dependent protein kinase catalytic subunit beta [Tetrabaena socialis]|eukprot:PNH01088.1 cAMP-dependent protein kinase catalytic subunit beta [Tetrabaena socialis]